MLFTEVKIHHIKSTFEKVESIGLNEYNVYCMNEADAPRVMKSLLLQLESDILGKKEFLIEADDSK